MSHSGGWILIFAGSAAYPETMQPMKLIFVLCLVLTGTLPADAQQLSPYVISSSGGEAGSGGMYLSYTAGELTSIATYSGPSGFLTQGFQQPWDLPTGIRSPVPVTGSMDVFPNPTDGHLQVSMQPAVSGAFVLTLTDLLGRELLRKTYVLQGGTAYVLTADASHLATGIYLARMTAGADGKQVVRKIQISK